MNATQTSTPLTDIAAILRRAQRVLAICHISPDGDAIGSLLGFGWLMHGRSGTAGAGPTQERGITLACVDNVPTPYRSLPGATEIISDPPDWPWDVVVALDASDPQRLGGLFRPDRYGKTPIINLDHHVTNLRFGDLNYVDTQAAATAQIMVDLADALGVPIGREAATCLLTGLVTDTLSFRTSNVTAQVMATALRLMEAGANLAEITEQAMNYKPLSMMRLWGLALARVRLQGEIIWTDITGEMRAQAGAADDGDGGLTSFLIRAPEAKVSVVFSETPKGQVEIGFRARPGYNVSGVALSLGGGGHPQAAGCTISGSLAAAHTRVLPLLRTAIDAQNGNLSVMAHMGFEVKPA
ncbi:MAG: hypothetical protein CVU38_06005 [Chloroflexi bacterium HGW-Chloroflexi-1]|nr:MAG: hypothetical protein CVU38_06005 [Chloroflexi bacterium HGW-Chloroflexi-1]